MNPKELSNRIENDLQNIREETIIEKLELLERFKYPQIIKETEMNNLFSMIKKYRGKRFNEFMDRYLLLGGKR